MSNGAASRSRDVDTDTPASCDGEVCSRIKEEYLDVDVSCFDLDRQVIEGFAEGPASSGPIDTKAVLKRLNREQHDAVKASKYFQSEDFKQLAPNVFVKMSSGNLEAGEDPKEGMMNSDNEGSDSEGNSDVSESNGECQIGSNRTGVTRGSYDFVRAVRNDGVSDVEISTDNNSDFDSDLECSSLSISECENEDIDDDNSERHQVPGYTPVNGAGLDEADGCVLISEARRGSYFAEYQKKDTDLNLMALSNEQSGIRGPPLNKKSRTLSYEQAVSSEGRDVKCFHDFPPDITDVPSHPDVVPPHPADVLTHPADVPTHPADVPSHSADVPPHPADVPTHPADVPTHPADVPSHPAEVPSYSPGLTSHHGYGQAETHSDDLQHSPAEDSPEDSQGYDPHSLIRKPAMRRKGFAWSSKSLPRSVSSDQMRQTYQGGIDSSQDLESSLIEIYGHRLTARARTIDNDSDHLVPQPARKSLSLPTRTDPQNEAHYSDVRQPPSGRQSKMDTEEVIPSFVRSLGDNMKRPLSTSSMSSSSATDSPSLPKKKGGKGDGDGSSDFLDDLIANYSKVSNVSAASTAQRSRHDPSGDLLGENRNGDELMDSTSITSSEAGSLKMEGESPSVISTTSYDKISSSSIEDAWRYPLSPSESYSRHAPDDHTIGSVDISRLSSSSLSRHEARKNFFTNYEEYIHQLASPQSSAPEADVNSSSTTQSPASSKSSSVFQVTAPTSPSEVHNTGDSSFHTPLQDKQPSLTPSRAAADTSTKFSRSSERASRRSDRRGSNAKHEGLSSRAGFSRSSKKRDHGASSEAGNRSSQGIVSYVSRVVTEIVESERTYIASLEDIIHGYLEPMENLLASDDAKADLKCLFSNIREIYKFGCTFLADLELAGTDSVQVAQCFVKHNQGFVIYTDYCTNYPRAVEVLTRFMQHPELSELCKQRQLALGHGLPLGAYLLKPVQRILKYHLLLHNLMKNCDKGKEDAAILEQAFHHMTEMAHHINEMKRKHEHAVRIQEIQSQLEDYVGEDLTRLGELVLEGTFKVYGAKASRQVFLFERGLLISKKKEGGMLSCKAFIQCSNLMLVEVIPNEPLSFHVIPFDNPRAQYTLQARNMEQKKKWCQDIKQLILESFKGRIPDNVKSLIMQLGREHDDDYVSKESLEAGRKNQHTAPEYLEKRRFRGKSGSRIPDFSLLKPQKAKRGGNKKTEVRPRENISQDRSRRKSKSPEGHLRIFPKQNVPKSRSQSPMSPTVQRSESEEPKSAGDHTITELVFKDRNLFQSSLQTSPESPNDKKSQKFTYTESEDKDKRLTKRPASFLLARQNPILSGDLTNLLTRNEQAAVAQGSLALTPCEEGDKMHPHLKTQHDSLKQSLKNESDAKYYYENDGEENPTPEDSRKNRSYNDTVSNETCRINEDTLVDNKVGDSCGENMEEPIKSESNQKESVASESNIKKSLGLKMSVKGDGFGNIEKENKPPAFPDLISASEKPENIYENVSIPMSGHQTHKSHQHIANNAEEESQTICSPESLTAAEKALKKKALRFPNTFNLMSHDFPSDPCLNATKAKLTDWNSKEKLTKGSMDDLSHLDEDPWVRNSEVTPTFLNIDEKTETLKPSLSTPTRSRGYSDVSEIRQVSGHKENLDWMVYLNRISPSWSQIQSPEREDLKVSTSAVDKYQTEQKNQEDISKLPSPNRRVTLPESYMTNENIFRRGSADNISERSRNSSNLTSAKGNALGISPVKVSIIKPVSFSSRGLVRSNSTPISDAEQVVTDMAAEKERAFALDIGRITDDERKNTSDVNSSESVQHSAESVQHSAESVQHSAESVQHSAESVQHSAEMTSQLPTIKIDEEEEAKSKRLSVVSSISTSSYDESQSNSSSDGLVGTLKNKLHAWAKPIRSRHDSEVSCTSTLTSDDEDKEDIQTKSGNTFEPAAKNRNSWKEDRQLEIVLREHSLGSSKLGSRMAHTYTQPLEQVISHHHFDSFFHESHLQDRCGFSSADNLFEEKDKVPQAQFQSSASTATETTIENFPPVSKIDDAVQTESELCVQSHKSNNQSHESSIKDSLPVKSDAMLETTSKFPEEPSKEAVSESEQKVNPGSTVKDNSNLARSDSTRSVHSNDSYYERKFSAVFDAEDFLEKSGSDKHNEETSKEVPFSKKSIREYVKDLEEKFRAQSPKVFEVKRREPGTMIRQRLETLRESALHGRRHQSVSSSKPACDEKSFLFHHNRKTFTMPNDHVSDSKFVYLKSSKSRDSFSKSVENLSKSRDNVFLSASRDSLASISRSRDSLNSVSDVVGNRHSAPVFKLKTNNSGHEKDANRFHYRTPENNPKFSGNQFVHRAYSGSQHSLSESEAQHALDDGTGHNSIRPVKSAYRLTEPSSEVDNLHVMRGWVRSLISKFQVKS